MSEKTITVIPKKPPIKIDEETGLIKKLKVCAYARVSTDFEDQKNSFEFQKKEFEERIKQNPEWEFVEMFSDEGISGTNTTKRIGFQNMIKAAEAGKIDLILIKSLSRFARNTVDCLSNLRHLAELGVSVYFEKENITTNRDNVDLILTIQAAIAESESRSISENVKWGIQKRMEKGVKKTPVGRTIGYANDQDGNWYITRESILIKKIFELFIAGLSYNQIIKTIEAMERDEFPDSKRKWNKYKIYRVLRNERYKGTIIHQKMVTIDVLTHKKVKNDGIEPIYIIDNHHEPIVSAEIFDYVQMILDADKDGMFNGTFIKANQTPLSGLIICENCGRTLRRIKYPYNENYILTCKNRVKCDENYKPCDSDVIDYELAELACLKVLKEFNNFEGKDANNIIKSLLKSLENKEFVNEYSDLSNQYLEKENELNKLLKEQVYAEQSEEGFDARFKGLKQELQIINFKIEELQKLAKENRTLINKKDEICSLLTGFSGENIDLIKDIVSFAVHKKDGSLRFVLKNNMAKSEYEKIKDELLAEKPIYESYVENKNSILRFDVISFGGNRNVSISN